MDLKKAIAALASSKNEPRYCYLPKTYWDECLRDEDFLDLLVDALEVPGMPAVLKRLSLAEKRTLVEKQCEFYRTSPTSMWRGVSFYELIAARLFADIEWNDALNIWLGVKKEEDLREPVARWLQAQGLTVFHEVPMGRKRIDVLGYREKSFLRGPKVVGVELKNDLEQFKRGFDQMSEFAQYSTSTYLACSPFIAALYLEKHADGKAVDHWDPEILNSKVKQGGFGLLLVEDDDTVEHLQPREGVVAENRLRELLVKLK